MRLQSQAIPPFPISFRFNFGRRQTIELFARLWRGLRQCRGNRRRCFQSLPHIDEELAGLLVAIWCKGNRRFKVVGKTIELQEDIETRLLNELDFVVC